MTLHPQKTPPSEPAPATPEAPAARIIEALSGIRLGSVEITVHTGASCKSKGMKNSAPDP
ncbi:DUF2292 domain-containing protein [Methylococcus sp. Mc7]|uniref:DUF2292 domain-containing protein n=1 Tax=Methylococcus sp. Mc7 TaxID=2860258 RepID=UPI001C52D7CA|nr:DUF2292 domain-containing protein [Methylococcus sp. Mc7]QXP82904.1 YezD family protein [Methylococcus sp. Mc7]